jgi:prepilin-type N-terminal cleavage/methylation domain-containing protein
MRGFTLIEMMLVVGIMAIVLAMGLPAMVRVLDREPLRQAVSDVVEALSHARALAILQGRPSEMAINGDYHLSVRLAPVPVRSPLPMETEPEWSTAEPGAESSSGATFEAALGEDIMVTSLRLNDGPNLVQVPDVGEVRIRFFPNGTCDDFEMDFEDATGARRIKLDPVTGFPDVVSVR